MRRGTQASPHTIIGPGGGLPVEYTSWKQAPPSLGTSSPISSGILVFWRSRLKSATARKRTHVDSRQGSRAYPRGSWKNPLVNVVHVVDPVDSVARRMRGRSHLPPYSIRARSVGIRPDMGGREFVSHGMDIERVALEGAEKNRMLRNKGFRFDFLDIRNDAYNPDGRYEAAVPGIAVAYRLDFLESVFATNAMQASSGPVWGESYSVPPRRAQDILVFTKRA